MRVGAYAIRNADVIVRDPSTGKPCGLLWCKTGHHSAYWNATCEVGHDAGCCYGTMDEATAGLFRHLEHCRKVRGVI